ncbi:ATP-binding protein [Salinispirillum sp. LH 10-3-1]|uniref:histidine kinase n=1 Tax=Salinispirillum sp. LH 10-3-1 TaxID=2952525 RepID=A0AB38YJ07_9GAMM
MISDEASRLFLDQLSFAVCIVDAEYSVLFANRSYCTRAGMKLDKIVGMSVLELYPEISDYLKRKIDTVFVIESPSFSYWEQRPHVFPFKSSRPVSGDEELMYQNLEIIPISDGDVGGLLACLCVYDVTLQASQHLELQRLKDELQKEHAAQKVLITKLEDTRGQLMQSEKMASIGQLAAGIAHEINNPLGFITSNVQSLQHYLHKYHEVIDGLDKLLSDVATPEMLKARDALYEATQLAFMRTDSIDLIQESQEGSERVMSIVTSLKDFSHIDNSDWAMANLVAGIESTLKIVNNQIKYSIDVIRDFAPDVPEIYCQPMQLNQVVLNLLINASQAMEGKGEIRISLQRSGDDYVKLGVKDTGTGIEPDHMNRLFEPFFTTKEVGSGTGLGLSVSYSIIKAHQGTIEVASELGKGTEFTLTLPVDYRKLPEGVEQ